MVRFTLSTVKVQYGHSWPAVFIMQCAGFGEASIPTDLLSRLRDAGTQKIKLLPDLDDAGAKACSPIANHLQQGAIPC